MSRYRSNTDSRFNCFLGPIIPNIIAGKLDRFNVTCFTTVICAILWLSGRGQGLSVAFAALFGISPDTVIGQFPVLTAMVSPLSEMGTRIGTSVAFASFGVLTSPPVGNATDTSGRTYIYMAIFVGLKLLVAAPAIWLLWTKLDGWALQCKVRRTKSTVEDML